MTRKQEKAPSQQKRKLKSLTTGDRQKHLAGTCNLCVTGFNICVSDTCTVAARSISVSVPSIQIWEEGKPSSNLECWMPGDTFDPVNIYRIYTNI